MLILVIALAACGGGTEPSEVTDPTTDISGPSPSTTGPGETPATTLPTAPSLSPADEAVVEAAIDDLADHLDLPTSDITLVSFERVTWNDGALGCPEPGVAYTQALVDGSRTVLEADGATYAYHAGQDDDPFLCDRPDLKPGPDPSVTIPRNDT